jgi:hypothetical protein
VPPAYEPSTSRAGGRARAAHGDWQTPDDLAATVTDLAASLGFERPGTVLEATCGRGAFLRAAARRFPGARLAGYELREAYAAEARAVVGDRGSVRVADFFDVAWEEEIARMRGPILVLGNPPWVTSAQLGALGSANLPAKSNFKGLRGYDALTGKSNFDVSEWMILRLIAALAGRDAAIAVLCKSHVARRVIEVAARGPHPIAPGRLLRIDAGRSFDAAVDAVLFVCRTRRADRSGDAWPIHASLSDASPESTMAVVDGILVADSARYARTRHLAGRASPEWRSGVKHDCARIMELSRRDGEWHNGLGERVRIEERSIFPLLKSSDVANGRVSATDALRRALVMPQRRLGEDTTRLRTHAPKTWAYLAAHGDLLDARKSSIYARQPRFALFGLGDYSFAPWKVAVSGLYKRCAFALVGPARGQPVVLDDTCYFLPFDDEASATRALGALRSPAAADYFAGRVFWDAKRPLSKAILQSLDLEALTRSVNGAVASNRVPAARR